MQEVLQRVHDNGYTYKGIYEGWYCPRCADFKVENEILEGNRCPIHEIELTREQEENWFFRLSAFQEPLERLFAERPDFVLPAASLQRGARVHRLGPRGRLALARAADAGGSTVPWDPSHVFYVWFDALLNYYTALGYARARRGSDRPLLAGELSTSIGKDILKFHTIFWPAMLMAAGHRGAATRLRPRLPARRRRAQDEQVAGQRARPVRGARDVRHRRAAPLPAARRSASAGRPGRHGRLSARATRRELANEYGNLASRTLNMLERYCDGVVPAVATDPRAARRSSPGSSRAIDALLDRVELSGGARARSGSACAGSIATSRSARHGRSPARTGRADELAMVLSSLAEGLRVVTVALSPYMPAEDCRPARCAGRRRARRPRVRERGLGRADRGARAALPEELVIDSHTHLDACEPPDAELRRRRPHGGRAADPHGRHRRRELPRRARGGRASSPRSTRPWAATPTTRASSTRGCCASSPRIRVAWRSARPALTTTATARPAPSSAARSRRRSSSRTSCASRS